MPYIITRFSQDTSADPGWPKIINDGTIDTSTSLNLLGRGKTNYGKPIAENFVRLLENFASNTPPSNPITGQLWYKVNDRDLYVCTGVSSSPNWQQIAKIKISTSSPTVVFSEGSFYLEEKSSNTNQLWVSNGSEWIRIGGLIFSNTIPSSANSGYLWYNPVEKTLRIFIGQGINDWLPILTTDFNENGKLVIADISGNSESLAKFTMNNDSSVVITSNDLDISDYSGVHTDVSANFPNGLKKGLNSYDIKIHNLIFESVEDNITATGSVAVSAYSLKKSNNFVTNATLTENGVKLMSASSLAVGLVVNIWNLSTQTINVYPPTGVTIDGNPSDTISSNNRKSYILRNTSEYRVK